MYFLLSFIIEILITATVNIIASLGGYRGRDPMVLYLHNGVMKGGKEDIHDCFCESSDEDEKIGLRKRLSAHFSNIFSSQHPRCKIQAIEASNQVVRKIFDSTQNVSNGM